MKMQTDDFGRVICGFARFSSLGKGLFRFEHNKNGCFDDRPTLRALALPKPAPFQSVEFSESGVLLKTPEYTIIYKDSPQLSKESLKVEWPEGTFHWGERDEKNLGAITTLDHFYEAQVPNEGVHPGGNQATERYSEMNLFQSNWNFSDYAKAHPEQLKLQKPILWTTFRRYEEMPEEIKKEIDIWKKVPPGPISRAGYWTLDETGMYRLDPESEWLSTELLPDYTDFYFGCYGKNYKLAMNQFRRLLGAAPLLPKWAYGVWYSRFYPYSDKEFKELVKQFEKHAIPLDVLIVDMDWHKNGWCGLDWNEEKLPNPKSFFEWKEQVGIHVGLNLHDEYIMREDSHFKAFAKELGIEENDKTRRDEKADFALMSEKMNFKTRMPNHSEEIYFFDLLDKKTWDAAQKTYYDPLDEFGVDFWWQDNWQGLHPHTNLNLWKFELMHRRNQKQGRRPMALNRYAGLGSHRYPAFFSGDTGSHWPVLDMEAAVNARAAHVNMSYFSHDLGGFVGELFGEINGLISPELYVRWMQLGALAPIMRVHSDHGIREPWEYGEAVEKIVKDAYLLHHTLVPYFYHLARECHDTGCPIIRPVYFEQPENEKAYENQKEYFIGENLFFSPITEPGGFHTIHLPEGEYFHYKTGELIQGPTEITDRFTIDYIPLFVKKGSIIPSQDYRKREGTKPSDPLVFQIFKGADAKINFYEDDGQSPDYEENFTRLKVSYTEDGSKKAQVTVDPILGSYKGLKTGRNLRFDFRFQSEPKEVLLTDAKNANQAVPFTYNEKQKTISVPLKTQSLKSPFELTLNF